jgi:hypothetical protein
MTTDGRFFTVPPSPELVVTEQAAKLWGCSATYLLILMKRYGVEPARQYLNPRYYWNPAVVLQVRRAHTLGREERRKAKPSRRPMAQGSRDKMRQSRAKSERLKILTRIAARQGVTVKELLIAKGLSHLYPDLSTE